MIIPRNDEDKECHQDKLRAKHQGKGYVLPEWDFRIGYQATCRWLDEEHQKARLNPKGMLKIPKKSENCLDDSTDD
jgi:hypothetical protein